MTSPNARSTPNTPLPMPVGLNARDHPFVIAPNECSNCYNVDFSNRSIKVRLGQVSAIDKAFLNLVGGIRGIHRYRTSLGVKKMIANSDGQIMQANDATLHQFAPIVGITNDADGYTGFCQYKDTLLIHNDTVDQNWYNSADAIPLITPQPTPIPWGDPNPWEIPATPDTTGGYLLDKFYIWRVTFTLTHGGDFLGETQAAGITGGIFYHKMADWTGGGTTNKMTFQRPSDTIIANFVPTYATRVNFYRSPALDAIPLGYSYDGTDSQQEYTNLFFIGSVAIDAAFRAAAAGSTIFTDLGAVQPRQQIPYDVMWYLPRPRYVARCKGRVFAAHCSVQPNGIGTGYVSYPDRIYFTRNYALGEEPLIYNTSNWISTDRHNGEGITGIAAWRDELVLVWEPNSTYIIAGGDQSLSPTTTNLGVRPISQTVGCIAPKSIVDTGDMIIWLANGGIYAFNGAFQEINTRKIQPILDSIPAGRKRLANAFFDSKKDEYVLNISRSDYPTANTWALRYNVVTGQWRMEKNPRGVGAAIEYRDSDGDVRIFWGFDDNSSFFVGTDPIIVKAETGFVECTGSPIPWLVECWYNDLGNFSFDKSLGMFMLEGDWIDPLTFINFRIDNNVDTLINPAGHISLIDPPGGKGLAMHALPGGQLWGKRIQVVLSGGSGLGTPEYTAMYLNYEIRGQRRS